VCVVRKRCKRSPADTMSREDAWLASWNSGSAVEVYEVERVLVAGSWDEGGAPGAEGVISSG
jgi:hypothetical protein